MPHPTTRPSSRTPSGKSGVIPYRRGKDGLEVLLVTSSTRKRWIIPKGNVEPDLGARRSAEQEAYEEAGARGRVRPVPFGSYDHDVEAGPEPIEVYLMEVRQVADAWPENHKRDRRWMPVSQACDHVLEPGLKRLLLEAAEVLS